MSNNAIYRIIEKDFIQTVESSGSYAEILEKLNIAYTNFSFYKLKKRIEELNLTFVRKQRVKRRLNNSDVFVEVSNYSRTIVRNRLISDNLIDYICEKCKLEPSWNGEVLSLHLDHKNGVNNDNRIENLRFLCPNCHSQTETYAGKNIQIKKAIYYCECGEQKSKKSKQCFKCARIKVKNKPSLEELLKEIEELGYCAVGRKYGVTDNAIRKWVKNMTA